MNYPKDFINKILLGDCLNVLPNISDEVIDLIYIDPPFGDNSLDKAYGLKWRDKQHYISWMRERILECRRVLKSTGSIYLQCDYHSNAHLRLLLDDIFGVNNFRNEIIWHYRTGNIGKQQFQRKHDTIFFYSINQRNVFNFQEIKEYYTKLYGSQFKSSFKGRKYGKDKYGEYLISIVDDVWNISAVFTLGKEHMFYPSQKPVKLLKRIIEASSNRDDIILDPMCGSGTTPKVAWDLMRNYIGIDIDKNAVNISRNRLRQRRID